MIELKNVTKIYKAGEKQVYGLRNLSLSISKGDFVVIIGPSGCGKSTLLNLVGGIDTPTKGEIIVDSQNLVNLNDKELTDFRKRKIGFVFQFFNLISTLTAIENVELSLKLRGITGLKARKESEQYLDMVGILELKDRFPSELSGGEQQRVGIARALAKNPVVLLADEPTGNLDTKSSQKVISTMHDSTRKLDTTVMVVTHNSAIAENAKHVVVLRDGEVVENKARLE